MTTAAETIRQAGDLHEVARRDTFHAADVALAAGHNPRHPSVAGGGPAQLAVSGHAAGVSVTALLTAGPARGARLSLSLRPRDAAALGRLLIQAANLAPEDE